uniref:Proteasome subunit beta type-3 n=2 Tax=Romanomermis culicivorax TaxID=13658 RepID=A0A915IGM9_ROMCU
MAAAAAFKLLTPPAATTAFKLLTFGSYFLEPVVAGLDDARGDHQPYICGMDSLGNMTQPRDFVASGNGESCIFGLAENYWREKMCKLEKSRNPDELMEATCQTLLGALEREASCGWGAVVYVVTPDRLIAKTLKARMD